MEYKLNICHLYPELMDTYGDRGNILAITYRCQKRGIQTNVVGISLNNNLKSKIYDLYFFGGGQDQAQKMIGGDLQKKSDAIKKSIESQAVLLSVCGGYQLLQQYFKTQTGEVIRGVGLFDAYTEASEKRMIQNLLIETNEALQAQIENIYPSEDIPSGYLVGFENHSGKTYLGKNCKPLGAVVAGSGNNGSDQTEGAIYKNAFGCYLHGSLLPKNPHFADYLITKALERKYGKVDLEPLDDYIEWQAHHNAIEKTRATS